MSITPSGYTKARAEIIALFGWNADSLTPDQTLRVDCAVALRIGLDDLQGRVMRGESESVDMAKMLVISEALARILPPAVLAAPPAEQREDRDAAVAPLLKLFRHLHESVATLSAENAQLKAQLAGGHGSALPSLRGDSTAITPSEADITPPGEIGVAVVGMKRGADDPPPMLPPIDAKAVKVSPTNPPAAPVPRAARPSRPPAFDDTPSGKAWQAWHDAGGSVGGDPWSNRNF
jgi:hypothetical protein